MDDGNQPFILLPVNGCIRVQAAKGNSIRPVADQDPGIPFHYLKILFAVAEAAASWTHHCHCPDIAVFLHKLKGAQGRGKPAQMQPAV